MVLVYFKNQNFNKFIIIGKMGVSMLQSNRRVYTFTIITENFNPYKNLHNIEAIHIIHVTSHIGCLIIY